MISFRLKTFSREKKLKRKIANAEAAVTASTNKAGKLLNEYNRAVEDINRNHGGNIDSWIAADSRRKGMYASGVHRNALQNMLGGASASSQEKMQKLNNSVNVQANSMADQTHNLGKTKQSVTSDTGNTFTAGGRVINVKEGSAGDVFSASSSAKPNGGNQTSVILTSTNTRRANDRANRDNRGFDVRYNTKQTQRVHARNNGNANTVAHVAPRQKTTQIIRPDAIPSNSTSVITQTNRNSSSIITAPTTSPSTSGNSTPIQVNRVTTPRQQNRSASSKKPNVPQYNANLNNNFSTWAKNNKGLLIGSGIALAGLGTAAALSRRRRDDDDYDD